MFNVMGIKFINHSKDHKLFNIKGDYSGAVPKIEDIRTGSSFIKKKHKDDEKG
jgi:hypothetical protein